MVSDVDVGDQFGISVVIDGDFLVVGVMWNVDCGVKCGSVYVY